MSRELDAEVAEKVMGHRIVQSALKSRGTPDSLDTAKLDSAWGRDLPRYSTDIAAAFQVVEKMRERGWYFKLGSTMDDPCKYICGYYGKGFTGWNGRPDFEAICDTMPEAICLAALSAAAWKDGRGEK